MIETEPELSIIIPVYNCEKYIKDCVESIIKQNLNEKIEIVVIDDGSVDRSGNICDELARKNGNMMVFHRKNHGVSNARNFGLKKASGKYVYFVDADDIIFPNCLEYVIEAIKCAPDIVSVGYKKVDSNINYAEIKTKQFSFKITNDITETKERFSLSQNIIKRELLRKNNLELNEKLKYTEDMDLALEAIVLAKKIAIIDNPIYGYRNNSSSATKVVSSKRIEDLFFFVNKWSEKVAKIKDIKVREYLGNFLAYQTLILLGMDNLNHGKMKNKIDCALLLKYHKTAKTRLGYICYKTFGFGKAAAMMGKYLSFKGLSRSDIYG